MERGRSCAPLGEGGAGAEALAREVAAIAYTGAGILAALRRRSALFDKINAIATRIYRAKEAVQAQRDGAIGRWEAAGHWPCHLHARPN